MKILKLREYIKENMDTINRILDKINSSGIDSLSDKEKVYLDQYSKDTIDKNLEKSLNIEKGYVFESNNKNIHELKFIYEETNLIEDEIIHNGKVIWDGNVYEGGIFCDKDGNYDICDFHLVENNNEFYKLYELGDDLIYIADGYEDDIEDFFDDVCKKIL